MSGKRVRMDIPGHGQPGDDDDGQSERSTAQGEQQVSPRDAHAHRLVLGLLDGLPVKPRTVIYLFMWGKLHGFLNLTDTEVAGMYQANKRMAEEQFKQGSTQQLELAKSDLAQLEEKIDMDKLTEPQRRDIINSVANMITYIGIYGHLTQDETHGVYKAITGKKNKLIYLANIPVEPSRVIVKAQTNGGMRA